MTETPTTSTVTSPPSARTPTAVRPPTPWWALVLAVLSVLLVLGLLVAGVAAAAISLSTTVVREEVSADGVDELRIDVVTGGIDIRTDPSLGDRVEVSARVTTTSQETVVAQESEGGVLTLGADCPEGGWIPRCEAAFDIAMGPDTDLVVDVVTGGVTGSGLAGEVRVDVVTGGVDLSGLESQVVAVEVVTGGVDLDFATAPSSVSAQAQVGGVTVQVPDDGTAYQVTSTSGVGGEDVRVPTSSSAERVIDVSTQVGGSEVVHRRTDR